MMEQPGMVRGLLTFATLFTVVMIGPFYALGKIFANDPPSNRFIKNMQEFAALPIPEILRLCCVVWIGGVIIGFLLRYNRYKENGD